MPKAVTRCRICRNDALEPMLSLGNQRLSGVFPHPEDPGPSASPLDLVRCDRRAKPDACGLLQLAHTADLDEMYGATYGYHSSLSTTMVHRRREIVDRVVAYAGPRAGDLVVDIGCNDGTLLTLYEGRGLVRVGIDPSSKKFAASFQPDIRVVYDFFSEP